MAKKAALRYLHQGFGVLKDYLLRNLPKAKVDDILARPRAADRPAKSKC
jgi:hypothetical protein